MDYFINLNLANSSNEGTRTYTKQNCHSGYRAIKDGSRFNPYFPPPDERDRIIIDDGEVTDTVELMEKVVWK